MNGRCPVVVAAGGTGGHLFPAAALSHALAMRGFEVHLVTDRRAAKFGGDSRTRYVEEATLLTPLGQDLRPVVSALGRWGEQLAPRVSGTRALIRS